MSDIIYTPPASGGGGTTINPTDNFIPVRLNATTFVDSNIFNQVGNFLGTYFLGNGAGFYLDYSNGLYQFGDYSIANQGTLLNVDDTNQVIITQNQGNDIGLNLDFLNNQFSLGDYNVLANGISLTIDDNNQFIISRDAGNDIGIFIDFANTSYYFGDFNGINNSTYIFIKDGIQTIQFFTENLDFNGSALQSTTSSGASGRYLVITLNGTQYKIALDTP